MARAVGISVSRVTIGRGPLLFSFRFANAEFEFNRFLTCGGITFMEFAKRDGYFRRLFAAIAAAPAVDIVLLLAWLSYYGSSSVDQSFIGPSYRVLPFCFIIVQANSLIMGLFPWAGSKSIETVSGVNTSSDGHQLITILFNKDYRSKIRKTLSTIKTTLEGYGTGEEIPALPFSGRSRLARAYNHAGNYITTEEIELAISAFEWLLQQDDLLEAERILIYDHLSSLPSVSTNAWAYRERALQEWLPEAEKRCRGTVETLQVTRGILSILNHSIEEGEKILLDLHESTSLEHDRFGCKMYLAVAEAWRGNAEKSNNWIQSALEIKHHNESIKAAETYIKDARFHPQQPPKKDTRISP